MISYCLGYVKDTRLEDYRNYLNLKDEVDAHQEQLTQECLSVQKVSLPCSKLHEPVLHYGHHYWDQRIWWYSALQ